jgi:hypothetical protein
LGGLPQEKGGAEDRAERGTGGIAAAAFPLTRCSRLSDSCLWLYVTDLFE